MLFVKERQVWSVSHLPGVFYHREDSNMRRLPSSSIPSRRSTLSVRRQGAILSMELVLVLPIFMLVLFSIVEFSMLSTARTRLTDAARHGARMLCISDRSHDDVREQVQKLLGSQLSRQADIEIHDSKKPGDIVNVHVRIPMANASPDLLWMTGFSVRNRYLGAEAPMAREHDVATSGIERL